MLKVLWYAVGPTSLGPGPDDLDLTDKVLLEEIGLLADVMLAAGRRDQSLTDAEMDEALGLSKG